MNEKAYLITNIEEYGKFIAFCINKDITVWRTYWDEKEKGNRCYQIDWKEKRCYYANIKYYEEKNIRIVIPFIYLDEYGNYQINRGLEIPIK